MAKSMRARRRETLATTTLEALDGFVGLAAAMDKAREKYRSDLLTKRPPNSFTVKEFVTHYNQRAQKEGTPGIGKRTAEELLAGWTRSGEYQRGPMMVSDQDGKSRRTYVYWSTTK